MRVKYRELPTKERLIELYTYCPDTGIFKRACDRKRWKAGQVCGTKSVDGYININVDGRIFRAHRLAWVYMTGDRLETGIDHINGDRSDNRWSNLRLANQSSNLCNRGKQSNNKSGKKGVFSNGKGKYFAAAQFNGSRIRIGPYETTEEAHKAYKELSAKLHGDFSNTG